MATHDNCTFIAVSNTTAKLCCLDAQQKPSYPWYEAGQQTQGSVNWLRNGKAFLTTQGGNVVIHVLDTLKEKPPVILSLPAGPLLARVGGDGKCLVLIHSGVPGAVHVYDMQSLLGSTGGSVPAKPPVVLQDHDRPILALAASTSSTHVASSNAAGSVYLHDAGSGVRSTLGSLPGGPALMTPKRCLAFSQLNKPLRLAAGADDGQVLVWQIAPTALGPVVMHTKLRGRVMGVGFAAYQRTPSAVLLSCSENGQLSVADLRTFPNVQAAFSVELNVAVSCMAVRDDGQVVAVGTKDGRVGLLRVDELLIHKQNLTKANLIRVFDLGTHLDVVDIAFQRIRESRESRDAGRDRDRESREGLAASTPGADPAAATQQHPHQPAPADVADGARVQGLPDKQDSQGSLRCGASTAGSSPGSRPQTAAATPTAASTLAGSVPAARPGTAVTTTAGPTGQAPQGLNLGAAASGASTGTAPSSGAAPGPLQPQPSRQPLVPPIIIPGIAPPVVGLRRPSDVGTVATPASAGSAMTDDIGGLDAPAVPSPAARALAGGTAGATGSPSSSPRPRSPRATMSSTGGAYPTSRLPVASAGGDTMAAGLRAYLDDFRQEVRDLVRGLQADMVRQSVATEIAHRNDVALLQQENRQLREEVQRLSQQLDAVLRFGLLGQQRGPWNPGTLPRREAYLPCFASPSSRRIPCCSRCKDGSEWLADTVDESRGSCYGTGTRRRSTWVTRGRSVGGCCASRLPCKAWRCGR